MIRILSDLHLGHSASRVKTIESLAPLLEGCEQIVFAGDIWQERKIERTEAEALFAQLQEAVGERGLFLRGNHDPGTPQGVAWLAEGAMLVTHGDAVFRDATPWSREMWHYRREVREIVKRYDSVAHEAQACSDRAKEIALTLKPRPLPRLPVPLNFFATALWPPLRTYEMIRVWATMGAESLRFLERVAPEARFLVCGHFHRAGIWESAGRVVINTGSYMRMNQPWCVDLEGEWVTVRRVAQKEGVFLPGEIVRRWRLHRE